MRPLGSWAADFSMRRRAYRLVAKVTLMPMLRSLLANWRDGLMWPCAGNVTKSTWRCSIRLRVCVYERERESNEYCMKKRKCFCV